MKLCILIICFEEQYQKLERILELIELQLRREGDKLWLESTQILPPSFSVKETSSISGIWKQARDLVDAINGAAKLTMQNWLPITLKNMQWEDDSGNRKWMPITASGGIVMGSITVEARIQTLATINTTTHVNVKEIHPSALYLSSAVDDESVAKVLRLINREMDWTNLYRLLEVISEDVGGIKAIVERGWASEKRINIFKRSANNTSVSGDDSRHGKIQSGRLPEQSMELREARHFIDQLLREWLSIKVKTSFTS